MKTGHMSRGGFIEEKKKKVAGTESGAIVITP